MLWMEQLRMRVRMLFGRRRATEQLDEELRYHLERQIEENRSKGMNAQEARETALRGFGNPALLREEARSTWSWNGLESLLRDLRYGVRALRHAPGFTAIAITVMALGIGANVALFTVVRSVILKPLPYRDQDRLIAIYENSSSSFPFNAVAPGMFSEWVRGNRSFSSLAMIGEAEMNLSSTGGDLPEKLNGIACTANLLPTLGVEPALGRSFTADEDKPGANRVVLLSWGLWQRRFGGNAAILNQTILLDKSPYTVIGTMPKWFAFPDATAQVWTPIYRYFPKERMSLLGEHDYSSVGRLKPGVSLAQAQADLSAITHRVHDAHLDNAFISQRENQKTLLEDTVGDVKKPLYVLLTATGCVLLIACLNVANLLVARAAARRKEQAIRMALGGGRLRLIRERIVESLLLSSAGGLLGVLLAWGAVQWLVHVRHDLSRVEAIHMDAGVVAFAVGIVLFCAFFAGLIASFGVVGDHLCATLQDASRGSSAGRGHTRLRRSLLAAEVGLTVVLLVSAGLLLKSYARLRSSDLGCTTKNVLTMRIGLMGGSYHERAQVVAFYRTLLERVRALPGIEAASFINAVPGQGYWGDNGFTIVEHPPLPQGQLQFAIFRQADSDYFRTMGIPVLRGQNFDPSRTLDQADQVIINASFASKYFPGEDPIGKHLSNNGEIREIIGVAADTRYSLAHEPQPMQYFPLFAGDHNNGMLVIRSNHDVEQFALPVQRVVQSIDHDLPVSDVLTMDQMLGKRTLDNSFDATLLLGFAVLSLVLAAAGLFGVLSYVVARRTGEIGIRLALGAPRAEVLMKMLVDGLKPALVGLVFGLSGSVAVVRLIRSMLFHTQPLDPVVFAAVAGAMLLVAVLACLVPAWRVSRLDPARALRTE